MRWFWGVVLPAAAAAWWSVRGARKRARYYARQLSGSGGDLPPASVIVPVKGAEEGLRENLAALAALDYPDYELIVAARAAADIPTGVLPPRARVALAGSRERAIGEKVNNLLAGVAAARRGTAVFAFADSDGRVSPGWLAALARALREPSAGAATAYRWYLPEPPDVSSLVRSVWNAAIFGLFGPGPAEFAWGGAMAIRRDLFFRLGLPRRWRGAVSDDYALTAAVRAAGLAVVFAPGAVVACLDHTSMPGFFAWARRQLILTRVYHPRLWWLAFLSSVLYCGAMTAALAVARRRPRTAACALALLLVPGALKGRQRAALARTALPQHAAWFRRYGWAHFLGSPLASWVWLATGLASAHSDAIEWRGRLYRLPPR